MTNDINAQSAPAALVQPPTTDWLQSEVERLQTLLDANRKTFYVDGSWQTLHMIAASPANVHGLTYKGLQYRINIAGMSIDDALALPATRTGRRKEL